MNKKYKVIYLPLFYKEMERVRQKDFEGIDFEYIFVNDGSKDKTLEEIKKLREQDIYHSLGTLEKKLLC